MRIQDDIITNIIDLRKGLESLKTRQPTGSDQIVMRTYTTENAYDWVSNTVAINPQAVSNAFRVDVSSADHETDLLADVIIIVATNPAGPWRQIKDLMGVPLSATPIPNFGIMTDYVDISSRNKVSRMYQVSLRKTGVGGGTGTVYAKVQVVANTDVSIEASTLWG